MAKALSAVGKVAGVIASVAMFIPGGQPIAAAAAAVSMVANVAASAIGTPRPPVMGSITDITIGADQQTPMMIGDTYYGGKLAHRVGYGPTIDKVPNPYLSMAVVYSAGGPLAGIDQYLADFESLTFNDNHATGYFGQILHREASFGPALQPHSLGGPWGAIPNWGAAHKLSGKAHVVWNLKWDSKNGKYQAGAPQLGIRARGVLTWDPRKDSTRPGGSGAHRWADPRDRAAFDAAKATWTYSNRPGLHALRYALGTWERDLANPTSDYRLTFGIGLPIDGIVVEDFVELENICEANDWTVSGVLLEPGDKAENLKRILIAGGAEICWKGGRLGLKVTAPRLSLDTITRDDIADDDFDVPGVVAWRDRINTGVPKFRSPAHQWQMIAADKVKVAAFIAEDGEEKPRELPFEFVTDGDQAAELTAYEVWNAREQGPVDLPVKPRLRHYAAGDRLTLSSDLRDDLGLIRSEVIVLRRRFDPVTMKGTLTIVTETIAKHSAVLGTKAVIPAGLESATTEDRDRAFVAAPGSGDWSLSILPAGDGVVTPTLVLAGGVPAGLNIDGVVFEYREFDSGDDWTVAGSDAATATRREIAGVKSATAYEVAVRYAIRGVVSGRRVIGPITTPVVSVKGEDGTDGVDGVDGTDGLDGASAVTLVPHGPTTIVSTNTLRSAANAGWGADAAHSKESYSRGAIAQWTLPAVHGDNIAAGLAQSGDGSSFENITFAILRDDNGGTSARINGAPHAAGPTVTGEARFAIEYDYGSGVVSFRVNGTVFSTYAWGQQNDPLFFKAALASNDPRITDISLLPRAATGAKGDPGANAPLVRTQWSIDGSTGWHDNYFGADRYYRQSNDNGATWGPAIRGVGEAGAAGTDGQYTSSVYLRSDTVPATPASNTGDPPTGWSDAPPAGSEYLWMSAADFRGGAQLTSWSAPARISAKDGADGFSVDTETTNFVQPVFSSGANKPAWTDGSGTIRLNKGGARITAGVTYAVLNNTDIAGLSLTGDTFSFAGATADKGSFTIRATYAGVNYDKVVSVKKVYDGEAAFKGSVAINGTAVPTITATGTTTVPGGRGVTVSAAASYMCATSAAAAYQARLFLYWRNVTDNGPWNLLGQQDGSWATRTNNGTVAEPDYENIAGAVSGAFNFTAPSTDKQIGFEARISPAGGGGNVNINGSLKLEVSS